MRITICGSIEFAYEIKEISEKLKKNGHEVEIPITAKKILKGELTMEEFKNEKKVNGDASFRKIKYDVIKKYYEIIKNSDAVLVLNLDKNEVRDYIGGNTFLEIGFAHVLGKKIFLFNSVPEIGYKDEIMAMQPMVLSGDLNKIN